MQLLVRVYLLLILMGLGYCSSAQKNLIRFQNITIDNGLAQGSVTGIVHGQDGYMWIATAEGLHRYDGYNFKFYRNDPQKKNSLPDNYISCLFEDAKGNLIIGMYSGQICILNKNTSTFNILPIHKDESVENANPVSCINDDGKGSYLIGYEGGGFVKYDTTTKHTKVFKTGVTTGLASNVINCIVKDVFTGNYLVGTSVGLCVYNPNQESFSKFENTKNLDNFQITCVLTSIPDKIWIGTYERGLYEYRRGSDSASKIKLPKSKGTRFISFLLKSPHANEVWVGTKGGVYKIENANNLEQLSGISLYTNNPLNPESLVDNNTQTAIIDNFGSLWIGTVNGLSRFDKRLKLFNLYREFKWKDTLINNNVYYIYEDYSKTIWLGTLSSGILKFNPVTEEITAWPLIKTKGVETKMVRAIYKDRSGQMWIGSRDQGLFKFYPEQNKFEQITGVKGFEISSTTVRYIFEDSNSDLWIGTANGLNKYDRKTNAFSVYRAIPQSPNHNSIYQISESNDKQYLYLACFRGGFQIFDKKNQTFKTYNTDASIRNNIGKSYAMCFEMLGEDSVMVGTYGGGLSIIHLDQKDKEYKVRSITEKQGLANNSVYGILRHGNNFWLSTNRGLSCYNIKTNEIHNYGLKNYVQSNEFNEGAYCKTSDGTFYFGGVNGFNYFKPTQLPSNKSSVKTVITAIKKGEVEVPFLLNKNGEKYIELHYSDNLISFEFATLNFISTQANQYAYKLEGFDDNWIKAGNRTIAYYTKLSPGNYVFKVKSLSSDSTSKYTVASIQIKIDPPFWKTWWFYSLIALLVAFLIYKLIKWRTQIIDKNYGHKLAELELKALRSQMNPHFIFNSLNSIQYFILKKEPKEAYNYLTKFSSLMRMILQNSKHKSISLQAEHDWLKTYLELENLRMENTLQFSINIDKQLIPSQIFVPTMVLQPYVENAIIHGLLPKDGDRKLHIEISAEGQNLKCTIIDNGIGRTASAELNKSRLKHHESTAMNLTKDRLAILNIETGNGVGPNVIDLFDENKQSIGTKVELILPLILQSEG